MSHLQRSGLLTVNKVALTDYPVICRAFSTKRWLK